ncbi:MAG: serine/threonine protein kinase [Deltaproteobacteria bacterium]|nr:serine/threonine protein kinase [Deltaproteobacteria bacterium]
MPSASYELTHRLGAGGMGEVFLAVHRGVAGFEKLVVIKRITADLSADPEALRWFIDEAKLVAQLSHPNIASVYALGRAEQDYFIVMEYVDGPDVARLLRHLAKLERRVPLPIAVGIVEHILRALDHAHTRRDGRGLPLGIVHRDISPHNMLLSQAGVCKLADFGVAKALSRATKTRTGMLRGKIAYMSPEQARGEPVDARSDLFMLGLVLHELVSGRRVRTTPDEAALLVEARAGRVPPLDDAPAGIAAIVARATAYDPAARYDDAQAFLQDMRARADYFAAPHEIAAWLATLPAASPEVLAEHLRVDFDTIVSGAHADRTPTEAALGAPPAPQRRFGRRAVAGIFLAAALLTLGAWLWRDRAPPRVLAESAPASTPVAPDPAPPAKVEHGSLTLTTIPWSYVTIDGKAQARTTPLKNLRLPAGAHRIELQSPGAKKKLTITVIVPAGGSITRVIDLAEEGATPTR